MKRKSSVWWIKLVVFLGLVLMLFGMVGSYALAATYDPELVKKAKAEGKFMFYSCVPDHEELCRGFEKRFGIKTEYYNGPCYPTVERFRTEQRAKRFVPDVFYGFTDVMLTLNKDGFFTPYKSPFLVDYDKKFLVKDNVWTTVKPHIYFFTVNTKSVPDKKLWPVKWADYLNPQDAWKNRIGFFDPRSGSAAYNVVYSIHKKFGEEKFTQMFKKIAALNPAIYTSSPNGLQACITGEKPFQGYMMNNHIATGLLQGAPLAIIVPGDGTPYIIVNVGVLKTSPHPNAARLFVDWVLDKEGGQKVYSEEMNQYALHSAAQPPKGFPKFASIDLWDLDFAEAEKLREGLQKKWAEIMGVTTK